MEKQFASKNQAEQIDVDDNPKKATSDPKSPEQQPKDFMNDKVSLKPPPVTSIPDKSLKKDKIAAFKSDYQAE